MAEKIMELIAAHSKAENNKQQVNSLNPKAIVDSLLESTCNIDDLEPSVVLGVRDGLILTIHVVVWVLHCPTGRLRRAQKLVKEEQGRSGNEEAGGHAEQLQQRVLAKGCYLG